MTQSEYEYHIAFISARDDIKRGDADSARDHILECATCLLDMYNAEKGICKSALYHAKGEYLVFLAKQLREEKKITQAVRAYFGVVPRASERSDRAERANAVQDWGAALFEKYSGAVAELHAVGNGYSTAGTGFVIAEGYLLTNDHVIFDEQAGKSFGKITMRLFAHEKEVPLKVIGSSKKHDVALCAFDPAQTGTVPAVPRLRDDTHPKPGEELMMIGNALAMGLGPVFGRVRYIDADGNLVSTLPSNVGDSGGPVFNRAGLCVGINKSITVAVRQENTTLQAHDITNATPMCIVNELLEKWKKQYGVKL